MKRYAFVSAIAAMAAAVPAAAQVLPPPAFPFPRQRDFGKIMQLRMDARMKMLNALSADHRQRLGDIFGALAVSTTPDITASVKHIDSLLSPQESQAILKVARDTFGQMHGALPGNPFGEPVPTPEHVRPIPLEAPNDAGRILIVSVLGTVVPRPQMWDNPMLMRPQA